MGFTPRRRRLREAGKKISAANAQKVKDAVKHLNDLLMIIEPPVDPDTSFGNQLEAGRQYHWQQFIERVSSDGKLPVAPTLADVRAHLQTMIDLIDNPDSRENLEGDGDGDNDAQPVIDSGLGRDIIDQAAEDAAAPKGKIRAGEAGDLGGEDASDTMEECPECDGKGEVDGEECPECNGKGEVPMKEAMDIWAADAVYEKLLERDVSTAERVALAKKGQAIPVKDDKGEVVDGRYPIANKGDLENAKRAVGRGNGKTTIKSHIKKVAKKLGMADSIPDNWDVNLSQNESYKIPQGFVGLLESGSPMFTEESGVALTERAVADDGVFEVKIIRPGWGSSGYYPQNVLEKDGPKVFKKGTRMFWDHPTKREESERPERSIRDLAARFVEDARYVKDHPRGEGLYAHAQAFSKYRGAIEELAPHIGASIRAYGEGKKGEMEGRKGTIVSSLKDAASVDFVTVAGAGGEINSRFIEAARLQETDTHEENSVNLQEAERRLQESEEENKRLKEAILLREAGDIVATELAKTTSIPDITKDRLQESLSANPPTKDGNLDKDGLVTKVTEAVKSEAEYIAKLKGGSPRNNSGTRRFNEGGGAGTEENQDRIASVFQRMGMSESASKIAAAGRQS